MAALPVESPGDRINAAWMRPVLSVIAGFGVALIVYGVAYSHGNPHGGVPDPLLAARLIPLELLLGVLAGLLVYRTFGRRQAAAPRPDTQERMVVRLALRKGGHFTLADLSEASPLTPQQAREVVGQMLEAGRLRASETEPGGYRLP
ncbi:hypothetical protein GCM10008957_18150 [Deinococcus ruber]|uniref:Uncharacterized protein n=2 Tax=Deinococcus ruber TaxID=1848197 RepID=A0A918F6C5_9DEIO|nr:hypothetical protein GCM10008957_18150 [Deinococcus ruber]